MIRRVALFASVALALASYAQAAPDPSIRNSVAVCDPYNPTQCLRPSATAAADGQAPMSSNQGVVSYNELFNGTTWDRWYGSITGGARVQPGLAVASTDASGMVATAGTYQTLQAANSARRGCIIVNTSANAETVRVNATIIPLAAGQTFSCAQGLIVNGDALAITSPTAGSSFSALFE